MEHLHRYHQALIGALTHEDSFDAVQGSTPDAHALPCTDEGMQVTRNVLMERCAKTRDLFIRNRSSLPLIAHESKHTRRPQYFQSLFGRLRDSDKCIAAEHGDFHHAPSVAPLVDLTQQWKKRAHTFFFKLRGDPLFVPGHGVN